MSTVGTAAVHVNNQ